MFKSFKNTIILIAVLAITLLLLFTGYNIYPRVHPYLDPQLITEVIKEYDTITRIIKEAPEPVEPDTIILHDTIPANIDTAKILQLYYSKFVYNRPFADSVLEANLLDTISENRPGKGVLTYRLLQPRTIINKTTNIYKRYLDAGINFNTHDPKQTGIDLIFIAPKGYIGAGYMPCLKGVNIKAGATIFKFKSK